MSAIEKRRRCGPTHPRESSRRSLGSLFGPIRRSDDGRVSLETHRPQRIGTRGPSTESARGRSMRAVAHTRSKKGRKALATKKEAILDAALDLFVVRGISAATTREIAKQAGTAEGNLYRHFESKDALARHLFGECAGRFRKLLIEAASSAEDPVGKIRALVRAIFAFAVKDPRAFAFIVLTHHTEFATGPIRNPQPLPKDVFCEAIRSGIESKAFRPIDPNLATSWIVGMTQRAIAFAETGRIALPSEEIVRETTEAALKLLASE